jgi:DNA uptake protein ComE-like DNA-binding protein
MSEPIGVEADLECRRKVRVNLANAQELLELPGLGTADVAVIVRFRFALNTVRSRTPTSSPRS